VICAVVEDPAVAALLQEGFAEVVALSEVVVGNLPVGLSAARPDIRIQEMPIGNVICDSILLALLDDVRHCAFQRLPTTAFQWLTFL
jgi:2',3'-cyclic-nucleotide 2'-phosphodiesterase (5'-nucleotidase family)